MTVEQHRENMLEKPFMRRALKMGSEETDPIHLHQLQLFCILKLLEERSPERAPGEWLSEREEMALKLSESIRACAIGQQGGISEYYDDLDADHRISLIEIPKEGSKGVAERVVDRSCRSVCRNY